MWKQFNTYAEWHAEASRVGLVEIAWAGHVICRDPTTWHVIGSWSKPTGSCQGSGKLLTFPY